MATRYALICSVDLSFNFKAINNILSKQEPGMITYKEPIRGYTIANLQNVMAYFEEMRQANNPISIDIIDKKYNLFYTLYFLDVENVLALVLSFENHVREKSFYYNIQFPNIALYLHIFLGLVEDYLITDVTIYYT